MRSEFRLLGGGMAMLGIATSALVVVPYLTVRDVPAPAGLKPYSASQWRGRQVYVSNGCAYCHSQQPRARSLAPDTARGWGRPSVAGDYAHDTPHLLGTMRTGPDLLNIGARQPSVQWHLGHLFQPRAYVPGSVMPSYPYLFELKERPDGGDVEVQLPPGTTPRGRKVVASTGALELVAYLKSLDRTHAVLPAAASRAASSATTSRP